jgi:hypothetical protein
MSKANKKPLRQWRITLVRAKGQYLGRVEAPDAETAIARAIDEFHVDCPPAADGTDAFDPEQSSASRALPHCTTASHWTTVQ